MNCDDFDVGFDFIVMRFPQTGLRPKQDDQLKVSLSCFEMALVTIFLMPWQNDLELIGPSICPAQCWDKLNTAGNSCMTCARTRGTLDRLSISKDQESHQTTHHLRLKWESNWPLVATAGHWPLLVLAMV